MAHELISIQQRNTGDPEVVVGSMITDLGGVSALLEMFYWTLEDGVLDAVRSLMKLDEADRSELVAFLAKADGECSVRRLGNAVVELRSRGDALS